MAWIRFTQAFGIFKVDDVADLPYPIAQARVEIAHRAEWVRQVDGEWVVTGNPTEAPEPECAALDPATEKAVKKAPRKRKAKA